MSRQEVVREAGMKAFGVQKFLLYSGILEFGIHRMFAWARSRSFRVQPSAWDKAAEDT